MYLQVAVVINEAFVSEFVHEVAYAGARCAYRLGKSFLVDIRNRCTLHGTIMGGGDLNQ